MGNYRQCLLIKDLDLLDTEKLGKQYVSKFLHLILDKSEDENKKKDIEEYHVAQLCGSMMTCVLSGDPSIINIHNSGLLCLCWQFNLTP